MNACKAAYIKRLHIKLKHLIGPTFHTATADVAQLLTGGGASTGSDVLHLT